MKTATRIILLTLAVAGCAVAEKPVKAPLTKYSKLWTDSPFTSKPVVDPGAPLPNLLDDYALLGVSPIGGGYRVTLINKKKPEDRITVDSDRPSKDFKILGVTRKSGDPLGTVVRMMSGTFTGTVSFDEKLLTLAPPPAAKPNPAVVPGQPGQPGQPLQPGQIPPRQPRPRVVPPPAPGAQPQPAQPAQATQTPDRPDRRGGRDR